MGRMYDHHILDMFELSISQFKPMSSFKGVDKPSIGSKPCVILKGDEFESNEELKRFGNLFIGSLSLFSLPPPLPSPSLSFLFSKF